VNLYLLPFFGIFLLHLYSFRFTILVILGVIIRFYFIIASVHGHHCGKIGEVVANCNHHDHHGGVHL
jgi:hypothetical protein